MSKLMATIALLCVFGMLFFTLAMGFCAQFHLAILTTTMLLMMALCGLIGLGIVAFAIARGPGG